MARSTSRNNDDVWCIVRRVVGMVVFHFTLPGAIVADFVEWSADKLGIENRWVSVVACASGICSNVLFLAWFWSRGLALDRLSSVPVTPEILKIQIEIYPNWSTLIISLVKAVFATFIVVLYVAYKIIFHILYLFTTYPFCSSLWLFTTFFFLHA